MIFSELYGAYYTAVSKIIESAISSPIEKLELRKIVVKYAFSESILNIEPAISEQRWQLIKADGTTPIEHKPELPLTILQKRWLKAISIDPRIRLFGEEFIGLDDIEPLFREEDIFVYDKYCDGDDFENENYIKNFRLILSALKNAKPLEITSQRKRGGTTTFVAVPQYLEYSEKDDKFRLIAIKGRTKITVNLGRITVCSISKNKPVSVDSCRLSTKSQLVEFELSDERNALERVLLHFSHFKKQAERIDDKHYRISITYDKDDETELLIRILSFGPMITVTAPDSFVELIKERLIKQKSCGL